MKKWFAAVLLAALVLTGCGPKQPEAHEAQLFAMDTLMSLRIWGDEALVTQTEDTLRSLEALLSATAEDSDIARLNRDGTAELQPQTADLLQQALDCAARTGGAFDPTVYPLVCLWGFPSGKYHVPTEAELTGALAHTGAQHLQLDGAAAALDTGCSVDLGGIAKGYA
ncbi:MAG: FAD:protein FMN transferase, partial [Oscillospiraceae bacterium]